MAEAVSALFATSFGAAVSVAVGSSSIKTKAPKIKHPASSR